MTFENDLAFLESKGVVFAQKPNGYLPAEFKDNYDKFLSHYNRAANAMRANDAFPDFPSNTMTNDGIPWFLGNYVDPDVIETLFTPMQATLIAYEVKYGDWTTKTAMFTRKEYKGNPVSYGDFDNGGNVNVNYNFLYRQSYQYQTYAQWGEFQLAKLGLARLNYASDLQEAVALAFNKFQNKSYLFGIEGLANYGLMNDPSLSAPITPHSIDGKVKWKDKDPVQIYNDILLLWSQLKLQTQGYVGTNDPLKLSLSPQSAGLLNSANGFDKSTMALLRTNFTKLEIIEVPEFATDAGELVQLQPLQVRRQEVSHTAYNDKMRSFAIEVYGSHYKQKYTAGTFGAVIKLPLAIAQMLGV